MASQQELVEEITRTYSKIVGKYVAMSRGWKTFKASKIYDLVRGLDEAITLARTGLEHAEGDEYYKITRRIETLEDYYYKAEKARVRRERSERRHRSVHGRLDPIAEDGNEDE
ncbi:hypothetical protein CHU98_g9148 [Xylaria longipes]|nr:hypothetical protein CHU98_g9148 [Xylaria longipes]